MKIRIIDSNTRRYMGGLIFILLAFLSQARQLVISHDGEVKYILQDHQMANVKLLDGAHHEGMLVIESDTSFSINEVELSISEVGRIKVKEGSSLGKGVGIVGLVGGTGLVGAGLSLLAQDDGLIIDIVNVLIAVPLIAVGVVIDAIAVTALSLSGGKWISVSGGYSKYQLSIV